MGQKRIIGFVVFAVAVIFALKKGIFVMGKSEAKHMTIAVPKDSLQLDPHKMEDMYSMFAARQVHRSLFRFGPAGDILPDLISTWSSNVDSSEYSFQLGDEYFTDGTPIEAKHVVASLQRLFVLGASISADMSYIQGAEDFFKSKDPKKLEITEQDRKTIKIRLKKPSRMLIAHLGTPDCSILKIENSNESIQFGYGAATSGSHEIVNVSKGSVELKLIKKGLPPRRVTIKTITPDKIDENINIDAVDTFDSYNLSDHQKQLLKKKGWREVVTSLGFENFILIDPKRVSLDIRKKLYEAIQSENLLKDMGEPHLLPAYGMIPPFLKGSLTKEDRYHQDSQNVRASKVISKLEINYSATSLLYKKVVDLIIPAAKKVGIELIPKTMDMDAYLESLFTKKSSLIIAGKGLDYPDGYANLAYFVSTVPSNYFYTQDSTLDHEIIQLPFNLDEEQRWQKYKEIQKKLLQQYIFIPLFFGNNHSGLWSPRLKKVPEHPLGIQFMDLTEIEIE